MGDSDGDGVRKDAWLRNNNSCDGCFLVLVALYSTHDGESIKAGKEWFNDEDELAAKNADPEGKIKTIPSWVETEADLEEYFSQTGAKVDRRQSGKVMKTEEAEVLLQDWTDTSDIPDENGVKAHGDIMHDGSEDKEPLFDMSGFKQPKFNLEQVNTFDKADILSGEYRLEDQQEAHKVKALAAQQADIEDADEIDEAMLVQRILGEKDAMSAEDRAEHLQRPWSDADLLHGLASSPETLMLQEEGPSIVGAEKHLQQAKAAAARAANAIKEKVAAKAAKKAKKKSAKKLKKKEKKAAAAAKKKKAAVTAKKDGGKMKSAAATIVKNAKKAAAKMKATAKKKARAEKKAIKKKVKANKKKAKQQLKKEKKAATAAKKKAKKAAKKDKKKVKAAAKAAKAKTAAAKAAAANAKAKNKAAKGGKKAAVKKKLKAAAKAAKKKVKAAAAKQKNAAKKKAKDEKKKAKKAKKAAKKKAKKAAKKAKKKAKKIKKAAAKKAKKAKKKAKVPRRPRRRRL